MGWIMKSVLVAVAFLTLSSSFVKNSRAAAVPRVITPLVEWQFAGDSAPVTKGVMPAAVGNLAWQTVKVPHVFRQAGLPDESAGWYRCAIDVASHDLEGKSYLELDGAASLKDVYVNGCHMGRHQGAFSRAAFDLTPALKPGSNILDVRVSNRKSESLDCFSRSTLYYVNGGMFRPARLVKMGAVHIVPVLGTSGVFLTPHDITPAQAKLSIETWVCNAGQASAEVAVVASVTGPDGKACGEFQKTLTIPAGATDAVVQEGIIDHPALWDLAKPNLYTVAVRVSAGRRASDAVTDRTGFRTIQWKNGRFYLNGRETQFRGVCKHAQDEYVWNAVSDDGLRREWQCMADMGANAVRLGHYPHSALEYDLADEHGMAVWAENGYAGQHWKGEGNEEKRITPDGERLTREMVRQNWNHPSILFWSAGNETEVAVVSHYAQLIRQEDSTRLVTYASCGPEPSNCDFVAQNTYHGWYGRAPYTDFAKLPLNALVSETGGGDWITHHVPYGVVKWDVDKFEPEEYLEMFTEFRLQTVCRDAVASHPMFFWWNFREFYNLKFKNNRNTKGLVTLAGMPKDVYYLFSAFLNPDKPVVHLCGRHHVLRAFEPDNGIKAYANVPELTLTVNGTVAGTLTNGSYWLPDHVMIDKSGRTNRVTGIGVANVFFWKTPLKPGRNVVEVSGGGLHDRMVVYQRAADGSWPSDPGAVIVDLASSNPKNAACFVDRPVEAQGPVYADVDGSSDNTFDVLPREAQGASWIVTRRLSDPAFKTDLSFRINPRSKGGTVFVMFSTGTYPVVTLKQPDEAVVRAASGMRAVLAAAGFRNTGTSAVWRDHFLNRADAGLWSRVVKPGESLVLPGQSLDYAVLIK